MKLLRLLVFSVLPVVTSACAHTASTNDMAELVRIHQLGRTAHFGKDASLLISAFADTMYSVQNGRVTTPERNASLARFRAYFANSTFIEWDDIAPPIIRISNDGSMAYVIVSRRVRLTARNADGTQKDEHTIFAWTETYEKRGGRWRMTSITSTERAGP